MEEVREEAQASLEAVLEAQASLVWDIVLSLNREHDGALLWQQLWMTARWPCSLAADHWQQLLMTIVCWEPRKTVALTMALATWNLWARRS